MEIKFYNLSIEQTLKHLKTDYHGLSEKEAKERLAEYNPNKLPEEKRFSAIIIFFDQFKNILIYILLVAALISLLLADYINTYVILAAVILNVIVGFIQEFRAQNALAKLKKVVTFFATVRREGMERQIDNEKLVPGDIVILQSGNKVPADIRLIKVNNLSVNEASLTGESKPVDKTNKILPSAIILAEQNNMAFFGTIVVSGSATAIVVATGEETQLGKIATIVKKIKEEETPLQKKLNIFSKHLGYIILSLCFIIFLAGYLLDYNLEVMFTTAVAIGVAAIPEGLVVVITVILAIGMQRILKQQALVRKLIAAETLGSTNVICTDKTGTLTEGVMRVVRIITYDKNFEIAKHIIDGKKELIREESYFNVLKIGLLASDAYIENPEVALEHRRIIGGNPTDKALVYAASMAGLNQRDFNREFPRLDEIPFDASQRYMVTLNKDKKENKYIYYKGAPEEVLKNCSHVDLDGQIRELDDSKKQKLDNEYKKLSKEGLRILTIGYKKADKKIENLKDFKDILSKIIFVGFVGIKDPLRAEAKSTIELTKEAGIKTVMLTGDHKLTAMAIAKELGLPSEEKNVIEGEKFEKLTEKELNDRIAEISVFARVNPSDKLRIIDAWQEKGHVVAMTGDGVNDAPALKAADIGVALGSGTDVAKETADVVLLDNNFKTIVSAVKEGRLIYNNIKKVILYLMSDSFTEMVIITISLFFRWPLPLLAAQILWINLVTDGFPNIALTVEPEEKDIMNEKPVNPKKPILDSRMISIIVIISMITGLVALVLFYFLWQAGDIDKARTVIFTAVAIDSLFYVFSCRLLNKPIWRQNIFSNKYLIIACILGLVVQLFAVYTPFFQNVFKTVPLNLFDWFIVLMFCLMTVFVAEMTKLFFNRRDKKNK